MQMYTANLYYMTLTARHHKASHVIPCAADTLRGLRDALETALNANADACDCMSKTLVNMTGAEIEVFADGIPCAVWHVCRFNHYLLKGLEVVRAVSARFYVYARNVWERLREMRHAGAIDADTDQDQADAGAIDADTDQDQADAGAIDADADADAIDEGAREMRHDETPSQMGENRNADAAAIYLHWAGCLETTHRATPARYAVRRTRAGHGRLAMGSLFERRRGAVV
jgi:hypothetical protein